MRIHIVMQLILLHLVRHTHNQEQDIMTTSIAIVIGGTIAMICMGLVIALIINW